MGQLASIADALNTVIDVNLRVLSEDHLVIRGAAEPSSEVHKAIAASPDARVAMP